jgi:hypothetical protein
VPAIGYTMEVSRIRISLKNELGFRSLVPFEFLLHCIDFYVQFLAK